MYIIIGGDQKEYGPVSADDVRQWIAEGRLSQQSQVKAAGAAEFRPLGDFPEFANAFAPKMQMSPSGARPVPADPANWAERDYDLDIAGCVGRGWELFKKNFGTLFLSLLVMVAVAFGFFFILGLFSAVIPKALSAPGLPKVCFNYFFSAVGALVMGPLMGGLYLVYLKTIRGQATGVNDVFAGFQNSFMPLFLGYLTVVLVTGLCMMPFNYTISVKLDPLLLKMQGATPADLQNLMPQIMPALMSTLPILLICMIPLTYLSVNWMFTQALIIDRGMDFRTAMTTSWKRVHKHWWHVFGLVVVTGLLNLAGFCLCCVGLLLTVPVSMAALMFAYETIFSEGPAA